MALILAFDTATRSCSVVLAVDGDPLSSRSEEAERYNHAERLNVMIGSIMDEVGKKLSDLDAIAVGIGPGSYTGLRIGLSAAKGFCFALDRPIIGMSTLDVLVGEVLGGGWALGDMDRLHPMIDARRMEVFTAEVGPGESCTGRARPAVLDDAWCKALPDRYRHVVFGDGADKAADLWSKHPRIVHVPGVRPAPTGLAACAQAAFERHLFADLAYLVPDYGKEANLTRPAQ